MIALEMLGTSKRITLMDINKMELTLSIIIPTHNYNHNLNNLLGLACDITKKYEFVETIIIDSSDDGTFDQIIKKQCNNVRVLISDIASVDFQRNKGIDFAKGKYITFFDSDDIISSNFEEAVKELPDRNEDLILCPFMWTKPDNSYDFQNTFFGSGSYIFNKEDIFSLFYSSNMAMLLSSPWSKFFKKVMIGDIRFKGKSFEDSQFVFDTFKKVNSIYFMPICFYHYVYSPDIKTLSSTSQQRSDLLISMYMRQYKYLRMNKIKSQSVVALANAYNVWKLAISTRNITFWKNLKLSFTFFWFPLFDFRKKPQLMMLFILSSPFLFFCLKNK